MKSISQYCKGIQFLLIIALWDKILFWNKIMVQNLKLCTNDLKSKEIKGVLQIMI